MRISSFIAWPSLATLMLISLGGCKSDKDVSILPTAKSFELSVTEDSAASDQFRATTALGPEAWYELNRQPAHGAVAFDPMSGAFTYTPAPDYFGTDSFTYVVRSLSKKSLVGTVRLNIENVNDVPTMEEIPDMENSAYSYVTDYQLPVADVDGDVVFGEAVSSDLSVADVSIDPASHALKLTPHRYGTTEVRVAIGDERSTVERTFVFHVTDVTKFRSITTDATQAIRIANTSDIDVTFTLEHNAFPMFQSDQEIVEYVRAMPSSYPGEPFERKLWRFVRDNTYHNVQLANDLWPFDPWVTVNSLGWGLCSQVAATYVRIARAAGYPSRIWGLGGHVVPEIRIGDRWEMYDPDLAVYYLNRNHQVASVDELQLDSTLITSPLNPVLSPQAFPYDYSDYIAEFYGPAEENVAAPVNSILTPTNYQPLTLPPGASLIYPLHVDESVDGNHMDFSYTVPQYLQARLTLPTGWEGALNVPWVVWGIAGDGEVEIDGITFAIGSQALIDRIRTTVSAITSVRVVSSRSPVRFTFFINALRYELEWQNLVNLKGKDVWALDARSVTVPVAHRAPWRQAYIYEKGRGDF